MLEFFYTIIKAINKEKIIYKIIKYRNAKQLYKKLRTLVAYILRVLKKKFKTLISIVKNFINIIK